MTTPPIETAEIADGISPGLAQGIRTIDGVLRSDGAVTAVHKALFTAAAACAQHQRDLTATSLGRARDFGLPAAHAIGVAPVLMLAWGEAAFRDFVEAVRDVYGPAAIPDEPLASPDEVASVDDALQYYAAHFGAVPARQRLFSELAPDGFRAYFMMHQASLKQNVLSHQTVELLLCTVLAAALQPWLLEVHVRSALETGATHAAIAEAILAAVPVAGFAAWSSSAAAIENTLPVAAEAAPPD